MESHNNRHVSQSHSRRLAPAGFRVVALHKNGLRALVSMAETRGQAFGFGLRSLAAVIDHRRTSAGQGELAVNDIIAIGVDEWVGTATEGCWQRLGQVHRGLRPIFNARRRCERSDRDCGMPKSGAEISCMLLPEKTRKGGWRAKVVKRGLAGPITNTTDVPDSAQAGQVVKLVIEAMSKQGRIQFRWP